MNFRFIREGGPKGSKIPLKAVVGSPAKVNAVAINSFQIKIPSIDITDKGCYYTPIRINGLFPADVISAMINI